LDSSRRWPGFANLAACPHLFGKKDTPRGSIPNEVALRISGFLGSTSKIPLLAGGTQH
jgi:hypothetical protein